MKFCMTNSFQALRQYRMYKNKYVYCPSQKFNIIIEKMQKYQKHKPIQLKKRCIITSAIFKNNSFPRCNTISEFLHRSDCTIQYIKLRNKEKKSKFLLSHSWAYNNST